jgi:hypothetical protein
LQKSPCADVRFVAETHNAAIPVDEFRPESAARALQLLQSHGVLARKKTNPRATGPRPSVQYERQSVIPGEADELAAIYATIIKNMENRLAREKAERKSGGY